MRILLNDSSVLLNLLASDCLAEIARATGWQFAICPAVRDEAKRLRDPLTGEMIDIDLTPLVAAGMLLVLELSGDEEESLYVEQAAVVDDGEAMSLALAAHRRLELAIDDKQATNHALRRFPDLRLWTTPEILKHWSETSAVSVEALQAAIRGVEARARYFPAKSHALWAWWQAAHGENQVTSGTQQPPH